MKLFLNNAIHLSGIIIKMKSKKTCLSLWVMLFLLCVSFPHFATAQLGTIYLGVGYNTSWYRNTNIHIEQGELNNSYTMNNVKANNKTNSAFSPLLLNYRLGFYFNEFQNVGMEIAYDPYRYAIKDNQIINFKGTVNGRLNVNRLVYFTKSNGSFYYMDGVNFFLLNFVRRYQVFRNNTKSIGVDAMWKAGVGPALPHFKSSLPVNEVDGPQFGQGGWNIAGEGALRLTLYRYAYIELALKYDYASFSGLKIYQGTAGQDLHTYGAIVTAGFTFPTYRPNPLFYKARKIITILPFYQHRDEIGRKVRKKKIVKPESETADSLSVNGIEEVPEFQEILDKKYKKEHPDTAKMDIDAIADKTIYMSVDSNGKLVTGDTLANNDSLKNGSGENPEHLSRRALRKKKKQEEKARKEQEKKALDMKGEEPAPGEPKEPETKTPEVIDSATRTPDVKVPDSKEPETKAPEVKEQEAQSPPDVKTPENTDPEKKVPVIKPGEQKEPEMSKKERRKKEKEDRKANKKKEKEDKTKQDQPNPENKEINESNTESIEPKAKAPDTRETVTESPDVKTPENTEPEKKEPEVKTGEQKEPEMSKKERRKKEKEDRKANKKKVREYEAKQEQSDQKNKENADAPKPDEHTEKKDN